MSKKEESRKRIEATTRIDLEERVSILERAFAETGSSVPPNARESRRIEKWIKGEGFEPMMFKAAYRHLLSKQRSQ